MKNYFLTIFLLLVLSFCNASNNFVKANGNHFEISGKPYYYIGTNYWYGPILASTGEGGNRKRLLKELDFMQKIGITNLRILAGAEGPNEQPNRVSPALQITPGKYNKDLLDGLDFLLSEMQKRNMYAILYLNNTWEWSGGYAQYLNWGGYGEIPYPKDKGWGAFGKYISQFHTSDKCKEMYFDHLKFLLTRVNRYTGLKYVDDRAIMSWQIANEPRAMNKENKPAFEKWVKETAALIKSIDKNHLVSTGSEGVAGCEQDIEMYERMHEGSNIDYLTIHIWPKNWRWLNVSNMDSTIDLSIENTNVYIEKHEKIARKLNKPIVLEEFGLPRDNQSFSLESTTTFRDKYYINVFTRVLESTIKHDALAGCNFWAFGGTARPNPDQTYWTKADEYMGDPPQEEQGLNSVFDIDSTIKLVLKYSRKIKQLL